MAMDIEKVYPWNYEMDGNEAEALVTQRFVDSQTYSADAYETLKELIVSLGSVFTGASMPETNIEYIQQDFSTTSALDSLRPEAPTDEQLEISDVDVPVAPTTTDITIPTLTTPSFETINLPSVTYSFSELSYASALADAVKAALISWINTGGTGLSADVEAAIWARAQARQQAQNEKLYADEENYFAGRGWLMPPGAMVAGLREINREIARANAQTNYEIMIEQARLAQANTQFAFTTSVQMEGQDKEFANQIGNRALQAAKDAVSVIVEIFDAKVKERLGQYELVKVEAEVAKTIVDMQAAANRSKAEIYSADIEKFKAILQKELGIIESLAKVYGFKVAGFEADAKVEAARVDA
jgi:hypothetical protein